MSMVGQLFFRPDKGAAMSGIDTTPLYQKIAESIREDILYRELKPGDRLPTVREMAERWKCTPGTVHRAYRELTRQGLIESYTGKGTLVLQSLRQAHPTPLSQAQLVHRAENFLLEVLTSGHSPEDVETAMQLALDRWRALREDPPLKEGLTLRFVGSHDPALSRIAPLFADISKDYTLTVAYAGSLGGLIALAAGEAELAGCHLWDHETDTYNETFVRRLLPGVRVALLTLAHRRLGLIVRPGNPRAIQSIEDLAKPGLRFANRQEGAGTRIWLDHQLGMKGIDCKAIEGYEHTLATHSELARAVAEDQVDVGLGVEAAAASYHRDFIPLTEERYDLVIPNDMFLAAGGSLQAWLENAAVRARLDALPGYSLHETGKLHWVE